MKDEIEEEVDLFVFKNEDQRDGAIKYFVGLLIQENLKELERIAILLLKIAQLNQEIADDN